MRLLRRRIGCAIVILITVPVAAIVLFFLYTAHDMVHCDYATRDLARNRLGDRLVLEEESCSGFGASVADTVWLRKADGGPQEKLFAYEPYFGLDGLPQPQAVWLGDRAVEIRISRVGDVFVRRTNIDSYAIRYRIGKISP